MSGIRNGLRQVFTQHLTGDGAAKLHCNQQYFPGGAATQDVKLSALNLHDTSSAGGLKPSARIVTIPPGALLLRLFRPSSGRVDFGHWWFTPYEYTRVAGHFGVDPAILADGRAEGRSALHGALALLSEWYGGEDSQLSLFHAAKTKSPMYAYYGEGDAASTKGYGRVIKPIRLSDGKGGYSSARQIFLPDPWTYRDSFELLTGDGGSTDYALPRLVGGQNWTKLPFE